MHASWKIASAAAALLVALAGAGCATGDDADDMASDSPEGATLAAQETLDAATAAQEARGRAVVPNDNGARDHQIACENVRHRAHHHHGHGHGHSHGHGHHRWRTQHGGQHVGATPHLTQAQDVDCDVDAEE